MATQRNKLPATVWEQAKIAFASGSIGLRELARNMNIPTGTMTARASREGWTKNIEAAKHATQGEQLLAATPTVLQSLAVSMQRRGERYVERMAGVAERVLPHLETLAPSEILDSARNVEMYDRVARRNYGLSDHQPPGTGVLNVNILTGQAAVHVIHKSAKRTSEVEL